MACHPTRPLVALAGSTGTIGVWSPTGGPGRTLAVGGDIGILAWHPTAEVLIVGRRDGALVHVEVVGGLAA